MFSVACYYLYLTICFSMVYHFMLPFDVSVPLYTYVDIARKTRRRKMTNAFWPWPWPVVAASMALALELEENENDLGAIAPPQCEAINT